MTAGTYGKGMGIDNSTSCRDIGFLSSSTSTITLRPAQKLCELVELVELHKVIYYKNTYSAMTLIVNAVPITFHTPLPTFSSGINSSVYVFWLLCQPVTLRLLYLLV